ncbi:MAG: DUF2155 domain-containing protein [Parvularculales bacterium]
MKEVYTFVILLCVLITSGVLSPLQAEVAVFTALDKVTARISRLEAPVDKLVRFGTLDVLMRTCHKSPPEDPPEITAFVQVIEIAREERAERLLFSGWMLASDPGLNAFEHPVYDIWLIDCKMDEGVSSDSEKKSP